MIKKKEIKRYFISGSRRLENFWWTFILFLGSIGFLLTGFSSYFSKALLPFVNYENIQFFPQGLIMIFYGSLGVFLSIYLVLILIWGLGSGFNEFNKSDSYVRIFRWGFPGKNRRIDLYYSWEDILGITVKLKQGLNSQYILFLEVKGQLKGIPLTYIGEFISFEEMEVQASALAKFLQVPVSIKKNKN